MYSSTNKSNFHRKRSVIFHIDIPLCFLVTNVYNKVKRVNTNQFLLFILLHFSACVGHSQAKKHLCEDTKGYLHALNKELRLVYQYLDKNFMC
jgi:chloramphenicol O-acetyltransferase